MANNTTKLKLILILQCVLCFGKENEQCTGYIHDDETQIRKVISGQNVTLSCDLGSHCERGLWAFREPNGGMKYLWEKSCENCGDSFSDIDVQSNPGINSSLIIYNISENLAGIYDCSCQLSNRSTVKDSCFTVAVQMPTCKLNFSQNGMSQVFDNSSGQSREKEYVVDVDVNDKLKASCDETVVIKTKCKIKENGFLTRKAKSQCYFSCKLESKCKTRILVKFASSTVTASMSPIPKTDKSNDNVTSTPSSSSTTSDKINGNDYNSMSIETSKDLSSIIISLSIFAIVLILIILCMLRKIVRDKARRPSEEGTWDNPIYEGFKERNEVINVPAAHATGINETVEEICHYT